MTPEPYVKASIARGVASVLVVQPRPKGPPGILAAWSGPVAAVGGALARARSLADRSRAIGSGPVIF